MGITDLWNNLPCKQVDPRKQGNRTKTFIFIVTADGAMLLCRRKIRRDVFQRLDPWFFIIRQRHCFWHIHIDSKPAFIIKVHFYLFINDQYLPHPRLEIRILTNEIIIDLIGLDLITIQDTVYCVGRYFGQARISCVSAVCTNMLLELPVCPQFLRIAKFFRFCTGDAGDSELFLITDHIWFTRTGRIINGMIFPG